MFRWHFLRAKLTLVWWLMGNLARRKYQFVKCSISWRHFIPETNKIGFDMFCCLQSWWNKNKFNTFSMSRPLWGLHDFKIHPAASILDINYQTKSYKSLIAVSWLLRQIRHWSQTRQTVIALSLHEKKKAKKSINLKMPLGTSSLSYSSWFHISFIWILDGLIRQKGNKWSIF